MIRTVGYLSSLKEKVYKSGGLTLFELEAIRTACDLSSLKKKISD
jgi:hypothetical protein